MTGRLSPELALDSSRIDVSSFADEGIAYFEWTLVFRNHGHWDQEATAQLLLPPGGVVTRANLWIDGEEREAAFGGRTQVREAYEAGAATSSAPGATTRPRSKRAWERAHGADRAAVLWLAGAQPLPLREPLELVQRMERRPDVQLLAIALDPSGHALLDALPARENFSVVRATAARPALAALGNGATRWTFARERLEHGSGVEVRNGDDPVALALRRLWASDEVVRLLHESANPDAQRAAAELAARYRVVTPVSGAVVLEAAAQYEAAGLAVPGVGEETPLGAVVPEPAPGLLLGLGLTLLAAKRRAQRAAARSASTRE